MRQKSKRELRKELAKHLAAVLSNPELPPVLYNAIADELTDLQAKVWQDEMDSARMLYRALDYHSLTIAGGTR